MRLSPTPRPPRLSRSGLIILLYAGLALVAVAWGALRGHANVFVLPGMAATRTHYGLAAGTALALFTIFLTRFATHRWEWARTINREFRAILGPLDGGDILVLAAASSVGEEALFRGAMLPHLGLLASSALFALPHIGPGARFLPWTLTSFFAGLAFGGLFLWSGDLAGSICAHFLINLINLRYITARPA